MARRAWWPGRSRQVVRGPRFIVLAGRAGPKVSSIKLGKNNPGWLLLIRLLVDGLDADLGDLAVA